MVSKPKPKAKLKKKPKPKTFRPLFSSITTTPLLKPENTTMQLTITDIKEFRDLMIVISEILATDVPLKFTPKGVLIEGMDLSHICLARVFLPEDYFASYDVKETIEAGVNFTDVIKVLKQMKGDELTLSVKDNNLIFILVNGTKKTRLKLKLIEIEAEDLELETLLAMEQDLTTEFLFQDFDELVKLALLISDLLIFKGTPDGIEISSTGTTGDMERKYTELTNFVYERDCENTYALSYLEKITKAGILTKNCIIKWTTDQPIQVVPQIDGVECCFVLAPRVEDDEDDMFED